MVNGNLSFN